MTAVENKPRFTEVSAYTGSILELPVKDISAASAWYQKHFGMQEVERGDEPVPNVILERDGARIGFAKNGGDSSQNGAVISVKGIDDIQLEIESTGANVANRRVDERDGKKFNVFFVVAPDGLCYYFNEEI